MLQLSQLQVDIQNPHRPGIVIQCEERKSRKDREGGTRKEENTENEGEEGREREGRREGESKRDGKKDNILIF